MVRVSCQVYDWGCGFFIDGLCIQFGLRTVILIQSLVNGVF